MDSKEGKWEGVGNEFSQMLSSNTDTQVEKINNLLRLKNHKWFCCQTHEGSFWHKFIFHVQKRPLYFSFVFCFFKLHWMLKHICNYDLYVVAAGFSSFFNAGRRCISRTYRPHIMSCQLFHRLTFLDFHTTALPHDKLSILITSLFPSAKGEKS